MVDGEGISGEAVASLKFLVGLVASAVDPFEDRSQTFQFLPFSMEAPQKRRVVERYFFSSSFFTIPLASR